MNFEKIVIIYICIFILTTDKPMAKALDVGGARTDFSQAAELYINWRGIYRKNSKFSKIILLAHEEKV